MHRYTFQDNRIGERRNNEKIPNNGPGVVLLCSDDRNRVSGRKTLHIVDNVLNAVPSVKLEIVCVDKLADPVVAAVQKGGHTGLRGDGKIYVSTVEDAVRISTGGRGEEAV